MRKSRPKGGQDYIVENEGRNSSKVVNKGRQVVKAAKMEVNYGKKNGPDGKQTRNRASTYLRKGEGQGVRKRLGLTRFT